MADWILIACLKRLFAEFDKIAPGRDHASDGSIGDTAHQHEVSDHNPDETGSVPIHDADHTNEVHAVDVDSDLRTPGLSMEDVVQFLLARCRSGAETRLRYIIYNRRIWEASNGWKQRAYTGSSAHTEHAHFSASYDTAKEASTASWHLEDVNMPSVDEIADGVVEKIRTDLSYTPTPAPGEQPYERKTVADVGLMEQRRKAMEDRLTARIDTLEATLAEILAAVKPAG